MDQNTILILGAVVVVVILLFFLLRGRKQKVSFGEQATPPMAPKAPAKPIAETKPAPAPVAPPAAVPAAEAAPAPVAKPKPAPAAKKEGKGVGAEVSAAVEDVVDQFIGVDAHPSGQDQVSRAGDELTRLKGLGPKAASKLNELGVTTFAQIAAWNDADVDAIDAQLGAFKGRIRRDRWVEQAKFLAKGDTEGFEAAFGKLG